MTFVLQLFIINELLIEKINDLKRDTLKTKLASHFVDMGSVFICQSNLGKQSIKFHSAYRCFYTNV